MLSEPSRHVVLVGLMGSGKSTIGRVLADRLGWPLIDSDAEVERVTGRTVRDIFETSGEPAFRSVETQVLLDAMKSPTPSIIAAAGGVVLSQANRDALRAATAVVWLRCEPDILVKRVSDGSDHRPLLAEDPVATLRTMHRDRNTLYASVATVIIDVDARTPRDIADEIAGVVSCAR
jgi:shikimate kinase